MLGCLALGLLVLNLCALQDAAGGLRGSEGWEAQGSGETRGRWCRLHGAGEQFCGEVGRQEV